MTGSNSLTSHCGESAASPASKFCGWWNDKKRNDESYRGNRAAKTVKKKANRKRRMFLKNPYNWDKI